VDRAAPTSVLIADDDRVVREILSATIRREASLRLAAAATDADEAIAAAAAEQPDVAIVDVHMPGGGVRATRGIKRRSPSTAVLALSSADDRETVVKMLDAGAIGYLVKGASAESILEAIESAASGRSSL